ncbi:gamma-glutamyl hydrolase-like [Anneissia japonica]|uniref:gamma-glutamyl hydrolase-like n=1 Tax=Anneissia japonica TaxID=1529436 RepID=UPI00142597AE|nr:gamma-glutamyl hydrolase-like [Anneissia japonica]
MSSAFVTIIIFCLIYVCSGNRYVNNRPVIGIVARKTSSRVLATIGSSVVVASYVKFIETGGARVVVIKEGQPYEYYLRIFNSINGVFMQGGSIKDARLMKSEYARVAKIMLDLAIESNKNGDYFPIWGTCLGFQVLASLVAGKNIRLGGFDAVNRAIPLVIGQDFNTSRMFNVMSTPADLLEAVTTENITYHNNEKGITNWMFKQHGLDELFKVVTVNTDRKGLEYISSIEAIDYPFYAVQWHPEKTMYEWNRYQNPNIPRTTNAIRIAQHLANFFASEARKSSHTFKSEEEELPHLISNIQPIFTGGNLTTYELCYFLERHQGVSP